MDHPSIKGGKRPRQTMSVAPRHGTRKSTRGQAQNTVEMSQNQVQSAENITVVINANLLQCCVCSGPLTVHLYQCTEGHILCLYCLPDKFLEGSECLVCGQIRTITYSRVMARVLAGVLVPCQFQQQGCTVMIPYGLEQDHRASCVHAPCHCPIVGCTGYTGTLRSLRDHVQEDHPGVALTRVLPGRLTPLKMRAHEQARLVMLRNGDAGAQFLVVVGEYMQLGRALSVVQLAGGESLNEQDFKYRIEVVDKAGVLSLSGEAKGAKRLVEPYEANPFLFIPNKAWDSRKVIPVSIELK